MSDANRVRESYIKEVTFGVTPAGSLKEVRLTSDSLGQDTTTATSNEIRKDRQIASVKRTNITAGGDVAIELSYGAHDDLLEAALLDDSGWSAEVVQTKITYAADASGGAGLYKFTDSGNNFITNGYVDGSYVLVSGFANAGNNKIWKIITLTAGNMTVVGTSTMVTEAAGPSVTIKQLGEVRNGTTLSTFSWEREYQDLTTTFEALRGLGINTFGVNAQVDQILTGTFGFLGKKATSESATIGTGYTVAAANDVLSAVDDIEGYIEGVGSITVVEFSLALANNLRARQVQGALGVESVGKGSVNVTGTLRAYFNSSTIFDKYLNFTTTRLALLAKDAAGNRLIFDIPSVRYTSGRRVAGGINTDVILDLGWTGFREASEDTTIRIARLAA